MVGGSRRVEPLKPQEYYEVGDYDWSSGDEALSRLDYALRKVKKNEISKLCDNKEIDFIEKRFEDTSRIIFKDLEQLNLPLLQKSYKRALRSDIIAIQGTRVTSATHGNTSMQTHNRRKDKPGGTIAKNNEVPTIEDIWHDNKLQTGNSDNQSTSHRVSKNAVSPVIQQQEMRGKRRAAGGGICRMT